MLVTREDGSRIPFEMKETMNHIRRDRGWGIKVSHRTYPKAQVKPRRECFVVLDEVPAAGSRVTFSYQTRFGE